MKQRKTNYGFTIVELLVVVVVIAILATITIVSYNGIQQRARDAHRRGEISTLQKALAMYISEKSVYPPGCGSDDEDSVACSVEFLEPYLTPAYLSIIPGGDPGGWDYSYVRGDSRDSYGILAEYEAQPVCKTGVNLGDFWGSGVPMCP